MCVSQVLTATCEFLCVCVCVCVCVCMCKSEQARSGDFIAANDLKAC